MPRAGSQTHSDTWDAGISRSSFLPLQPFTALLSFLSFWALLSFVSLWKRGGWEVLISTQHVGHCAKVL